MVDVSRRTLFGLLAAAPIALPVIVKEAAAPPATFKIADTVFTISRLDDAAITVFNNIRADRIDYEFSTTGTFTAYFHNEDQYNEYLFANDALLNEYLNANHT